MGLMSWRAVLNKELVGGWTLINTSLWDSMGLREPSNSAKTGQYQVIPPEIDHSLFRTNSHPPRRFSKILEEHPLKWRKWPSMISLMRFGWSLLSRITNQTIIQGPTNVVYCFDSLEFISFRLLLELLCVNGWGKRGGMVIDGNMN